jgi:integrase
VSPYGYEMPATEKMKEASDPLFLHKVAECLYRRESSGIYYALVKKSGKQYRRSLRTNERKLAERSLSDFREKIVRLSPGVSASQMNFSSLATRWLETLRPTLKSSSFRRRDVSLSQIKPYLGGLLLRQITSRACEEWAGKRSPEIAASTYNNERDTIIAILTYAKREGYILDNPATVLQRRKLSRQQVLIPTKDQFVKLVRTLRGMDRRYQEAANLVELLAYSGMRLAEATALRWRDVSLDLSRFVVRGGINGTKNREVREVPLFPAMKEFLERLRAVRQLPLQEDLVIGIAGARKAMEAACRAAKIPDCTHHTLRHYFVSNAIEVGIDFKVIAGWVGHKDGGLLVAKTYGHLRDSHSQEMAKRMTYSAA